MKILDKTDEIIELAVGDLLVLKKEKNEKYIGTKLLVCKCDSFNPYKLVSLDRNAIIDFGYNSLERLYEDYKEDIVKVIKRDNLELILGGN